MVAHQQRAGQQYMDAFVQDDVPFLVLKLLTGDSVVLDPEQWYFEDNLTEVAKSGFKITEAVELTALLPGRPTAVPRGTSGAAFYAMWCAVPGMAECENLEIAVTIIPGLFCLF